MSVLEQRNVKRLAIFFDNLELFDEEINEYGKMRVSCTSTLNLHQKCYKYVGDPNAK